MKIQRSILSSFIIVIAVLVASCSLSGDAQLTEQAVVNFHEMLDAEQFDAIYAESADDLKNLSKKENFVALIEAVHRKLGATKSSTQSGWNFNYNTSGKFVTLSYSTVYAEGTAVEQFVYRLKNGKALLAGYHINSNELIIR